jgi:hypothetical protein
MALKVVKGAHSTPQSKKGTFIIEVINQDGKIGYLCEIDKKACVSDMIIPEVIKFDDYDKAKEAANEIKGVQTRIIGEKTIDKILEQQGIREQEVVPVSSVEKDIFHVVVVDENTKERIGYVSFKEERYVIVAGTEGAAFWDSDEKVEGFISQISASLPSGLKLEKSKFN